MKGRSVLSSRNAVGIRFRICSVRLLRRLASVYCDIVRIPSDNQRGIRAVYIRISSSLLPPGELHTAGSKVSLHHRCRQAPPKGDQVGRIQTYNTFFKNAMIACLRLPREQNLHVQVTSRKLQTSPTRYIPALRKKHIHTSHRVCA